MKKIIITLAFVLIALTASAHEPVDSLSNSMTHADSLKVMLLTRLNQHTASCYKLYPTDNIWTFLELETYSGRIWQVQYSIKGDEYRFKTVLNENSLLPFLDTEGPFAGRFELYKTQNIHNFILLDTATGNTWQVQWGDEKDRQVLRIW